MRSLRLLIALLIFPMLGFAWSGGGHYTSTAVTYLYLKKNSPATINKVLEILKYHPWYNSKRWNYPMEELIGENRKMAYFLLASMYPDDAKDSAAIGGPPMTEWHFDYYPFVPAGNAVTGTGPAKPNAEDKITELLQKIKTEPNGKQRAIDLCWLIHLIEDVHQPLHVTSLFDKVHPTGDVGGTQTWVIPMPHQQAQTLHSYWDGLIMGSLKLSGGYAKNLLADPKYQLDKLPELKKNTTPNAWIKNEGVLAAREVVYIDGRINGTKKSPTEVPQSYYGSCMTYAERSIVLAGIRVANELSKALK